MLPKKNRAEKRLVEKIFKEGKFVSSPNLTLKFLTYGNFEKKISFVAPKSVAKLAVKRNLLRRRGYSALKKHLERIPHGFFGVFIFKKTLNSFLEIENEIKKILDRIN
jgi:ribonuclease P protein component